MPRHAAYCRRAEATPMMMLSQHDFARYDDAFQCRFDAYFELCYARFRNELACELRASRYLPSIYLDAARLLSFNARRAMTPLNGALSSSA